LFNLTSGFLPSSMRGRAIVIRSKVKVDIHLGLSCFTWQQNHARCELFINAQPVDNLIFVSWVTIYY
jgi:hypothetical protein